VRVSQRWLVLLAWYLSVYGTEFTELTGQWGDSTDEAGGCTDPAVRSWGQTVAYLVGPFAILIELARRSAADPLLLSKRQGADGLCGALGRWGTSALGWWGTGAVGHWGTGALGR
jgi:hypothetical protein